MSNQVVNSSAAILSELTRVNVDLAVHCTVAWLFAFQANQITSNRLYEPLPLQWITSQFTSTNSRLFSVVLYPYMDMQINTLPSKTVLCFFHNTTPLFPLCVPSLVTFVPVFIKVCVLCWPVAAPLGHRQPPELQQRKQRDDWPSAVALSSAAMEWDRKKEIIFNFRTF